MTDDHVVKVKWTTTCHNNGCGHENVDEYTQSVGEEFAPPPLLRCEECDRPLTMREWYLWSRRYEVVKVYCPRPERVA